MKLKRHLLITALAASLAGGAFAAKTVEKTLAIVNGEPILQSEFDKAAGPVLEQYKAQAPQAEQTPAKEQELKKRLLDQMIDDKILKQEAKNQKITVTKRDIAEGVAQVKKRFPSEKEFNDELKKENMTMAQFESRISEQIAVMKLIEREVKAKTPVPTDEQAKAFFNNIQKKMEGKQLGLPQKDEEEITALANYLKKMTAEQVRARHILVRVDRNADQAKKTEALNKIKKAQAELKAGADFGEVAKKYSEDPGSAQRGGDLGFFTKDMMVPEFSKAAFDLKVGEVSQPVQTDFGYHLIKVEERKAARKVTYDDIKNDLKELLAQKAAQQRYEDWVKELRAKAKITVNAIQ